MSFLTKKKNFLLFLLVFAFIFNIQPVSVEANNRAGVGNNQGESAAAIGVPEEDQKVSEVKASGLAGMFARALLGIIYVPLLLVLFLGGMLFNLAAVAILGVASFAFDLAMQIGVVGISDFVYKTDSITDTWLIFRNLANIGIIFVVIFTAITTILQLNAYDTKKQLAQTIVAALLLNFSFFFGAIVVDVSNQLSIEVYKQIEEDDNVKSASSGNGANLGRYFIEKTNVGAFTADGAAGVDENAKAASEATGNNTVSNINSWADEKITYGLSVIVSLIFGGGAALVLAIVLLIGAAMIFGRLIAILILLVVSPIAFVSMILPNTKKISRDWWSSLIGNCLYLPVFLLFIYLGIKITGSIPDYQSMSNANHNDANSALHEIVVNISTNVFNFAIIIGFFIAALIVAKKMSSAGSSAIGKISSSVTAGIGGAALASGAFLGRNTIGASASALKNSEGFKNFAGRMPPIVGGMLGKQLEGISKNSFDARNSRAFKGVASATGVGGDFANNFKPEKDGFKGQNERLSKNLQDTYSSVADRKDDDAKVKPIKDTLDTNEEALEKAIKREEVVKKTLEEQGIDIDTNTTYQSAKLALKSAQDLRDESHKEYLMAKNPVKQKFIERPENAGAIVRKLGAITRPWTGGAYADARNKLPLVKSEAEKQNEALLKALEKLNNQNKTT